MRDGCVDRGLSRKCEDLSCVSALRKMLDMRGTLGVHSFVVCFCSFFVSFLYQIIIVINLLKVHFDLISLTL